MSTARDAGPTAPAIVPLTHRAVLAVSVPIILSNVTTPLVGAVDTAVVGQLGDAALLGGVAVGAVLFQLLFWTFGFLRMGTSGVTAQAKGAGDHAEIAATLERALLLAVAVGLAMLVLQWPIALILIPPMGGSAEVQSAAGTYFAWRIWSAPFAFVNYALLGWFIGLAEAGRAFLLQVLLNLVNIAASIVFVLFLHWGVAGAGAAALIAEAVAAVAGLALAFWEIAARGGRAPWTAVMAAAPLRRLLAFNADVMIRNACLLLAFTSVTAFGARGGDLALAANGILLDLFGIAAYFLDGFANAAETFVGQAIGARQRDRLREALVLPFLWAVALSFLASAALWIFGGAAIDLMTTSAPVRETARQFLPWCAVTPLIGVFAFQLDGIFIGATRGRDMRNMMLVSLAAFFAAAAVLVPSYGNHGVWLALIVFFVVRGLTLALRVPALMRAVA
jgi:multidrug resistance protein, MATE family